MLKLNKVAGLYFMSLCRAVKSTVFYSEIQKYTTKLYFSVLLKGTWFVSFHLCLSLGCVYKD